MIKTGPDDATRERIQNLERDLAAAQHDLEESASTGGRYELDAVCCVYTCRRLIGLLCIYMPAIDRSLSTWNRMVLEAEKAKAVAAEEKQVSFRCKNPDFLLRNPDFLLRNPHFLLKNVDFIIKHRRSVRFQYNNPDFLSNTPDLRHQES